MFIKTLTATALVAFAASSTAADVRDDTWILIGTVTNADGLAGISAEFSSEEKCTAAKEAIETHPENRWYYRFSLTCVEK